MAEQTKEDVAALNWLETRAEGGIWVTTPMKKVMGSMVPRQWWMKVSWMNRNTRWKPEAPSRVCITNRFEPRNVSNTIWLWKHWPWFPTIQTTNKQRVPCWSFCRVRQTSKYLKQSQYRAWSIVFLHWFTDFLIYWFSTRHCWNHNREKHVDVWPTFFKPQSISDPHLARWIVHGGTNTSLWQSFQQVDP